MLDVVVNGVALGTRGETETNYVSGLGLLTFGELWECKGFWFDNAFSNGGQVGVSTIWLAEVGVSTVWSLCGASIVTNWTLTTTSYTSCQGE
jgi:hypothetical protein